MAFLRKGFLKSARRRNELYCRIDLSIATIISFLLLVIFMVLPQPHRAVALDLIVARNSHDLPNAIRDDAIKISLTRYGTFYFGNTLVRCEDLADMIREAVHDGAERESILKLMPALNTATSKSFFCKSKSRASKTSVYLPMHLASRAHRPPSLSRNPISG